MAPAAKPIVPPVVPTPVPVPVPAPTDHVITPTPGTVAADYPDRIVDEADLRPPPVKPVADDDEDAPAPAVDPIAPASPLKKGELARQCPERARAPAGFKRFRVRVINYAGSPFMYLIAKAEDVAAVKACYLRETGLATQILDEDGKLLDDKDVKPPRFDILVLKD
jgi:hypothetical protein